MSIPVVPILEVAVATLSPAFICVLELLDHLVKQDFDVGWPLSIHVGLPDDDSDVSLKHEVFSQVGF